MQLLHPCRESSDFIGLSWSTLTARFFCWPIWSTDTHLLPQAPFSIGVVDAMSPQLYQYLTRVGGLDLCPQSLDRWLYFTGQFNIHNTKLLIQNPACLWLTHLFRSIIWCWVFVELLQRQAEKCAGISSVEKAIDGKNCLDWSPGLYLIHETESDKHVSLLHFRAIFYLLFIDMPQIL